MVNNLYFIKERVNKLLHPATIQRTITSISRKFGYDRVTPIDRYYTEAFLHRHNNDIQGCVMEIDDSTYTHEFGGKKVTRSEILHAVEGNPQATLIGDLTMGNGILKNFFDCMIRRHTFLCIYDMHAAVSNAYAAFKSGGVSHWQPFHLTTKAPWFCLVYARRMND